MKPDAQNASDAELAAQTQAGSLAAFEELVLRYENRIYHFLLQRCGHPEDAQDITQETFVKAYQAIGQFKCQNAFAPWLFTIARRKCIDRFRAAEPVTAAAAPDSRDFNTPSELLSRTEDRRELWDTAREHLPPLQFDALWLRYVEEMSVEGIAAVLRKTKTHVKISLFRARKNLARHLQPARRPMLQKSKAALATGTEWQRTLL